MLTVLLSCLWFGVLTSISPCPLATNIAAISFLSKNISTPNRGIVSGMMYILGRMLTYVILGTVVVSGVLAVPVIANFLQTNISKLIAPLLIFVGLILLDIIKLNLGGRVGLSNISDRLKNIWFGPFVLGALFALSFCPISAALFFGVLTPMAIEYNSPILLPIMFGLGTGLPVMLLSAAIVFTANKVGTIYNAMTHFEFYFRKVIGVIFILAGIYFFVSNYVM